MRIGILHDSYSPYGIKSVSGEDQIVDLEIKLLSRKGHQVIDLRTYASGLPGKFQHLMSHSTGFSSLNSQILDLLEVDVIHCYNLNLRSGYQWLNEVKTPVVASLHNFRTICPVATAWRDGKLCFDCRDVGYFSAVKHRCGNFYGALGAMRAYLFDQQNSLLSSPRKLIATSLKMKRELSKVTDSARIDVLGSVSRFQQRRINRQVGGGFVYLGRFSPEKGVRELIQNWPSEFKLTLFGNGFLNADTINVAKSKNIEFREPNFSEDGSFLDEFEGIIFPSTWIEGSPLVIYEALSLGLPILCNPVSSASEILDGSMAGVIIENFLSVDLIRAGIEQLRRDYSRRTAECYKLNTGPLSSEVWTKRLENILASAC